MNIPWLKQYWTQCLQALDQGRLSHALLISGSAGLGKWDFAQALAQKILCSAKEPVACGNCQSCLWFKAKSHPDFFIVSPEEDKKQISIAQIRELSEVLSKTPYGKFQVVIINPAEAMNRAAANAILKTLEEPSGEVVLLLVSDQPNSLLPTIRSRCQELRLRSPSEELALSWLKTELSLHSEQNQLQQADKTRAAKEKKAPTKTPKKNTTSRATQMPAAEELLALADGSPYRALRLAQTGEWEQHLCVSEDFIRVLSGQMSALKAAELWSKQSPLTVLTILSTLLQDMIRLLTGLSASQIQHRQHAADLHRLAQKKSLPQWWSLMTEILRAKRRAMSTANPNLQLLLESVLLSFISTPIREKR